MLILALLVVSTAVNAQSEVRLRVVNATSQEPLADVIAQLHTADGKMAGYGTTDGKGEVTLKTSDGGNITCSLIGYEKQSIAMQALNKATVNEVALKPKNTTLREVIVHAPPISAKNDTLIYNAAAFVGKEDRYLEDLLKKLPGINVADNGTISYQGKGISRFTIEGQDLLGNNYNQATKNLPVDAVSNVEVMEHDQHKKVLRGKAFDDRAAINVKIKNSYKFHPFGEVQGGIGLAPTLWDNRLSITNISTGNQTMITGKMNNAGMDLSTETEEHLDISNIYNYEPMPSTMLSNSLPSAPFDKVWYLKNNSYSFGINHLIALNKDASLRTNILGYIDRSHQDAFTENLYGGDTPVNISEDNRQANGTQTYTPIFTYELNANKTYIEDELRYSFTKNRYNQSLTTNTTAMNQLMKNSPWYIQNKLNVIVSLGKNTYTITSFVRYYERDEALDVSGDSTNTYDIAERYGAKSLVNKNRVSTMIPLFGNYLSLSFNANYRSHTYDNAYEARSSELNLGLTPSYSIHYNGTKGNISLSCPMTYNSVSLALPTQTDKSSRYFSASPAVDFNHEFNSRITLNLSASYDTSNDPDMFYSATPIKQDYRTEYITASDIYKTSFLNASLGVSYHNLITMFFTNLAISYSDMGKEYYHNTTYTDEKTTINVVPGKYHSKSLMVIAAADKTITGTGLSFKGQAQYTLVDFLVAQNSEPFVNKSNLVNLSLTTTYQKTKWLKAIVSMSGMINWQSNQYNLNTLTHTYNIGATLLFFPTKTINVAAKYQNYINELELNHYQSVSLCSIEAKWKVSKKVELGLNIVNLFNYKSYKVTSYDEINRFTYQIPINGRHLLASCIYRI